MSERAGVGGAECGIAPRERDVGIAPMFAWYDLWVGVFIDRAKRRVYVFPLPCLGVVVSW